jgi:hypothetical protein
MAKSNAYPGTVVPLTGDTNINQVIQQTPTGTAVFQTDKQIYITEINQTTQNQKVEQKYSNLSQNITNIKNYPAGASTGLIQYYKGGNFSATTLLKWSETDSKLQVGGNIETYNVTISGSGLVSSYDLSASNLVSTERLAVSTSTNLGNLDTITINGGTLNADANAAQADAFMKTDGSGHLTWSTVDYVKNANLANYAHIITANGNIQSNVDTVGNTLTVGNLEIHGELANPYIMAKVGSNTTIRSDDGTSTPYDIILTSTGNIIVPESQDGNTLIQTQKTTTSLKIVAGTSEFLFGHNGDSVLGNAATANFFNGVIGANSNAQPNITSVGSLVSLTVAGNLTSANANLGNLATANYANIAETLVANVANVGNLFVTGNANLAQVNATDAGLTGNLIIGGNLFVNGTTTTVNSTTIQIVDPLIDLGGLANGASLSADDGKDRGMILNYVTDSPSSQVKKAFIGWDNSNSEFSFGSDVTVAGEVVTFTEYGNIRAGNIIANISGNLSGNLVAGTSNVVVNPSANVTVSVNGIANVLVVTNSGANIKGTITQAAGYDSAFGNITAANLVTANYFTGNLVNGTSSLSIASSGDVTVTADGVATIVASSTGANITGSMDVTGNVTALNLFGKLANGNSNISMTSNGNIVLTSGGNATMTVSKTGANIIGTANISNTANIGGNLTAANISGGNLVTANYFTGTIVPSSTSTVKLSMDVNGVYIDTPSITNAVSVKDTGIDIIGDLSVTGTVSFSTLNLNSITTTQTAFSLLAANATTINMGAAATTISMGSASGVINAKGNLQVTGNLVSNAALSFNIGTTGTGNITLGNATSTVTVGNDLSVVGDSVLGNAATANYFIGSGANLTAIPGANVTGSVPSATVAASANAVAGANVTGAVAFATTANAVAGANVSGAVAFATTANAVAGANVSGAVAFATTANAVAGANVSGTVPSATVAASANAVTGANVSGAVAFATVANAVSQANISDLSATLTANTIAVVGNVLQITIGGVTYQLLAV